MIFLVDGVPGAGKTYYAMRQIDHALAAGKVVCTNVGLAADWPTRAARSNPARRLSRRAVAARARELERRILVSEDLRELFRVRTPGHGEGRAVMVLDEAHRWLNSRMWTGKDRQPLVDWFTAHRHYGFDVYLITQYIDTIDKQVRNLVEYRVRLRNLRRLKVAGVSVIPFNFFAAVHELQSAKDKPVTKRDFYRLDHRVAGMYDTHALAKLDAPADAIWLPRDDGRAGHGVSRVSAGPAPVRHQPASTAAVEVSPAVRTLHRLAQPSGARQGGLSGASRQAGNSPAAADGPGPQTAPERPFRRPLRPPPSEPVFPESTAVVAPDPSGSAPTLRALPPRPLNVQTPGGNPASAESNASAGRVDPGRG